MAQQENSKNKKKMGIGVSGSGDDDDMLAEKASMIRESVENSQIITGNIVTILDSIDNGLSPLEFALRPTQNIIQSMRENDEYIDKTLKVMDVMLTHHNRSTQEVSPPLTTGGIVSRRSEALDGSASLTGTDIPPISPSDEFENVKEVSPPLTSGGRVCHRSEPLDGSGSLTGTDIPLISPSDEFDNVKILNSNNNSTSPLFNGGRATSAGTGSATPCSGPKTVGRENKKEENRIHNPKLHAAVAVAELAATVAAVMAAKAASCAHNKDEKMTTEIKAVVSAAKLVAAQCVEAAEAMGAKRGHLASVVSSAMNVHSPDDITNLRASAATALLGRVTQERGKGIGIYDKGSCSTSSTSDSGEISLELLAKGSVLLKRTRKGGLHWKEVSVDIDETGQVMLKMKSKHAGGVFTKKKKYVVIGVCTDLPAWPERPLFEGGKERWYFGLKTKSSRGTVEFECRNQREHDIWTRWVSRLLSIVAADTDYQDSL